MQTLALPAGVMGAKGSGLRKQVVGRTCQRAVYKGGLAEHLRAQYCVVPLFDVGTGRYYQLAERSGTCPAGSLVPSMESPR